MKLASHIVKRTLTVLLIATSTIVFSQTQPPSAVERVAALKTTLASSAAALRHYEWVETTVVSLKGEEKSRKQMRCYYGADGVLQKVEISASPPPEKKRGLRGKIIENKKEELTNYMKDAVNLVKSYVPPNSAKIQAEKDGGKVTVQVLQPGKRARLNFPNYEKPGDNLGIELDLANNLPIGVTVATYLEDPKAAVTLDVGMSQLDDGTTHAANITLVAAAKDLRVVIQNSGYRKVN